MRIHARTTTAITALALTVVLGGCNGGEAEPTDSTSAASSSSTTSSNEDEQLAKAAEDTYQQIWDLQATRSLSQGPTEKERHLYTEEAYAAGVEFAKTAPPTKAVGRDKLLSMQTTTKSSAAGPIATIEVCYEVHQKSVLTKDIQGADGKIIKKGTDIRTDPDDKPIKAGTEMVNLVTMKRGKQDDDQWKLESVKPDIKPECDKGESS
ncbi:hypothetical protein [Janibacter anophelis]|uniref:hypothetical protein n=1 Tax=Janibacter anophelis TaxID=319054 RepID=UPI000830E4CD|nr:hypothetical protein [Janibacter anophelis]